MTEELPIATCPFVLDLNEIKEDGDLQKIYPLEIFLQHQGFLIEHNGEMCIFDIEGAKDVLAVDFSSFAGYSSGAQHYYAKISLPWMSLQSIISRDNFSQSIITKTKLTRKVSKRDYRKEPDIWQSYEYQIFRDKNGFRSHRFDTLEYCVKRAKFIQEKHFPGFKLRIGYSTKSENFYEQLIKQYPELL